MGTTAGQAAYALGYQKSPIILCNGIAQFVPGKMLPIIAITQASSFVTGILGGSDPISLNAFWANFRPLSGGSLIKNEVGEYPFANQTVAANAIIQLPLNLSVLMQAPATDNSGFLNKLVTFSALKAALDLHNNSGGTYTVATPAFIYTNGLLLDLRDVTPEDPRQPQRDWVWDFKFPLLTQQQASTALGNLMSKVGNGTVVADTAWSSVANSLGIPSTAAVQSLVPGSTSLPGITGAPNVGATANQ